MLDTQSQRDLGRAKNALQDYLIHKLLIPKIYLDADWNGMHVDVLAIDRAGVGDVHAVCLEPIRFEDGPATWKDLVTWAAIRSSDLSSKLLSLPGHFRYIALFTESAGLRKFQPTEALIQKLTAADGVGRVGVLVVDFADDEPSVSSLLKAERFRSTPEIVKAADEYTTAHIANWEVRE